MCLFLSYCSYSQVNARVVASVCRVVRLPTDKTLVSICLLAVIEAGKQQGSLANTFSTRSFQRAASTANYVSQQRLSELVRRAIAGDNLLLLRPFSISVPRIPI